MAKIFSRRDAGIIGSWWWTVDRWNMGAILMVVALGIILSFAASPPVAERLNIGTFFFVKRHLIMIIPSVLIMFGVSLLPLKQIRRFSALIYLLGLALLVLTLFAGEEIKGARRWLMIGGMSVQASEFMKPVFAILVAWVLAEKAKEPTFPGFTMSLVILGMVVSLLLLQPDLGMTLMILSTWIAEIFIAGLPMFWVWALGACGIVGIGGAYLFLPHVTRRIDQFLNPASGDPRHDLYQITKSLEAFKNGGLFGKGPGEGIVKKNVPDAHADFVFAVAGEEFGLILCLVMVGLFCFITLRAISRISKNQSPFVVLATSGLAIQFGLQTFVNMASSLHLIPTKGITLPFISYGGSSLLAMSIGMGMLLALTRKRHTKLELL